MNETKRTQNQENTVSLDSIGIIPIDIKEALNDLTFKENVTFSTVEQVQDYLKKRQNLFTYALEHFSRFNVDTDASVRILKVNMGWEKKTENGLASSLREDSEAMFTGKDLCTLACITLITFLKDTLKEELKDEEAAEVHMLAVNAKKVVSETTSDEGNTPFTHNIVHLRIGENEIFIDPTYRQIDSEHPEPILFMDHSSLGKTYLPSEEGSVARYADNSIAIGKTQLGLTDAKIERFKQLLYVSD
jgi:hypothetical protein